MCCVVAWVKIWRLRWSDIRSRLCTLEADRCYAMMDDVRLIIINAEYLKFKFIEQVLRGNCVSDGLLIQFCVPTLYM